MQGLFNLIPHDFRQKAFVLSVEAGYGYRIAERHRDRYRVHEIGAFGKNISRAPNSDRNDRGAALNGQREDAELEVSQFTRLASRSFREDDQRDFSGSESFNRPIDSSASRCGIISVDRDMPTGGHAPSENRNEEKLPFGQKAYEYRTRAREDGYIRRTGVIGHEDIVAISIYFFDTRYIDSHPAEKDG